MVANDSPLWFPDRRSFCLALGIHARFRDANERCERLPHQDLVLVTSKAREQAKELLTRLGKARAGPQSNESNVVYLALVTLQQRLGESGSTATSCFPVRGALATRRAGQHPWPAALLPFSDAERH